MQKFKCPICPNRSYVTLDSVIDHIENDHPGCVPKGITTKQWLFNIRNKLPQTQKFGKSILSGKPTAWNEEAGRYERLRDDAERLEFRKIFIQRMLKTYGKETLLKDPEVQKKMLAGRKISGQYQWSTDPRRTFSYTGSYELDFLRFMDIQMSWDPKDIFMPCPFVIDYISPRDKSKHFYIPDAYIESLKLIVEIKSEDNKFYRKRDLDIETAKDHEVARRKLKYVKVYDKNYEDLAELLKSEIPDKA